MQTEFAQYCNPQDLAKDFGGTASKVEKKKCKSKTCKL